MIQGSILSADISYLLLISEKEKSEHELLYIIIISFDVA